MKDLDSENCKTLIKAIEEDTNKWEDIPCSWIRINIAKVSILPKAFYKFNAIPMEIPKAFFTETILKFVWDHKRSQRAKIILRENKTEGIMLPNFKLYYKAIVTKQDSISIKTHAKITGIKSTEISPRIYSQLLYLYNSTKEARIYSGERIDSNKWCWENWTATCKKMKLYHYLISYTNINSKWIKTWMQDEKQWNS